jgi:hypothetical protein
MRTLPHSQSERLAGAASFGRIARSAPVSNETFRRAGGVEAGFVRLAVSAPSATVLHQAARADRSRRIGAGLVVALRWLRTQLTEHAERRRRNALAGATYRVLCELDPRTLRDLGIDRSQLSSVAHGVARGSITRSPRRAAIASILQ